MPNRRRTRPLALCLPAALLVSLSVAPAAVADVRYAAPASTNVDGTCTDVPCRIDRAVAAAGPGDEVVLAAGTYAIGFPVRATAAVHIRPATAGAAGRPRLVAGAGLATPTVELAGGGSVRDLDVVAGAGTALRLAGGARGIGLDLRAGAGATGAALLVSAPTPTALVSSVAHATGGQNAVDLIDPESGTGAGGAALVNVTAVSTRNSSWGVVSGMAQQGAVLKNVIARGDGKDLHGRSSAVPIVVSRSNFRSASSASFTDSGDNQTADPVAFVDEAAGDLRLAAGSRPIDAGAPDPLSHETLDPDGNVRRAGSAPDIGAYEHGSAPPAVAVTPPTPPAPGDEDDEEDRDDAKDTPVANGSASGATPSTAAIPASGSIAALVVPSPLPPAAPPQLGKQVAVDVASGAPLVRLPGAAQFVPLGAAAAVPVGSTIDATGGHVRLTSVRDRTGRTQTGEFWGGVFVVRQARARVPYTDLVLTGGSFSGCPSARARSAATAHAAGRRRSRKAVVRKLWGRDHKGRFRTRGRNSVATVRGTVWLVEDRCDGTRTTVRQGAVSVRPTAGGRSVVVRAGRSLLVAPRG